MRINSRSGCAALAALLFTPMALAQALSPGRAALRVDPMTVSVKTIDAPEAALLKSIGGSAVLLLDVRSRAERAARNADAADDADAALPFAEPGFVAAVERLLAARGGDEDTSVLLLCRTGEEAVRAARLLTLAGFSQVRPIAGGIDGADGSGREGWRALQASKHEALLR